VTRGRGGGGGSTGDTWKIRGGDDNELRLGTDVRDYLNR
jgi:hypothetical protein